MLKIVEILNENIKTLVFESQAYVDPGDIVHCAWWYLQTNIGHGVIYLQAYIGLWDRSLQEYTRPQCGTSRRTMKPEVGFTYTSQRTLGLGRYLQASLGSWRPPHFTVVGLSQRFVSGFHSVGKGHSNTPTIPFITMEHSTLLAQLPGWGSTALGVLLHMARYGSTFGFTVVGLAVDGFSVFAVVTGSLGDIGAAFSVTIVWDCFFEPNQKGP